MTLIYIYILLLLLYFIMMRAEFQILEEEIDEDYEPSREGK